MRLIFRISLISFLGLGIQAWAAPHPGTSSSALLDIDSGRYLSPLGFSVNAGETNWIHSPPPKSIPAVKTMYKAPQVENGVQASLTLRIESMNRSANLKAYIHTFLKDYQRFGFDLITAKPVRVAGENAYLIDVFHRDSNKQVRQVVFSKAKKAVVLTCRDHKETFSESVRACNEIIKSFQWTKKTQEAKSLSPNKEAS